MFSSIGAFYHHIYKILDGVYNMTLKYQNMKQKFMTITSFHDLEKVCKKEEKPRFS